MNRILFLLILILVIIIGIGLGKNYSASVSENTSLKSPIATFVSSPTPSITYYPPKTLNIEKINVLADVESVGLDFEGKMDVPKQDQNVGWYNLGFKAGEIGSVVLAGHFDSALGGPAVFYNLNQLEDGDLISITDEVGKTFKYKITNKQLYDFDKLPLTEIFASKDKARLNLITCDGVFNQNTKNYSKRLVVYSELID